MAYRYVASLLVLLPLSSIAGDSYPGMCTWTNSAGAVGFDRPCTVTVTASKFSLTTTYHIEPHDRVPAEIQVGPGTCTFTPAAGLPRRPGLEPRPCIEEVGRASRADGVLYRIQGGDGFEFTRKN